MDLSGNSELKLSLDIDAGTGMTTLTLKDSSDVILGTIITDTSRFRPIMGCLYTVAREYSPDADIVPQGFRINLDKNAKTAVVEFG